ncbi:MAG: hypothetical protein KDA21_01170 [Phycisphaerales bacterium]|nr:hypothetical protein [Phycisphaerales bacterium]
MARNRQILLVKLLDMDPDEDGGDGANTMLNSVPLGTYRQIQDLVADSNVAPDGSPESVGILYGPGITLQLPMVGPDDPVVQVMVSLDEEEIAWPVLTRLCRRLGWKMLDPDSGRTFG